MHIETGAALGTLRHSSPKHIRHHMNLTQTLLVDGVQSMSVQNGVVRLELVQLQPDGKAAPVIQLQVPQPVVRKLIEALQNAAR